MEQGNNLKKEIEVFVRHIQTKYGITLTEIGIEWLLYLGNKPNLNKISIRAQL